MPEHDYPFRFNIGFIIAEASGYSREIPLAIPKTSIEPDLDLQNVYGDIIFTRTSEGIFVQARIGAYIQSECGRCLDEFLYNCKTEFTELYTFPSHATADTELIVPPTGIVDLSPLVREYLVLAMPINPICKPDCKGLCPVCGENLNKNDHSHTEDVGDPRLAVLKSLLE